MELNEMKRIGQCRNERHDLAFTLVELLVVIGVIAVLIGILLPALNKARQASQTVKCAANMRSAAQAMLLYANDNRGWLAGPHTSGRVWNASPNLDGNPFGLDDINAGESHPGNTPVQNMDWMSPTLGKLLTLPENDVERVRRLYNVDLFCPTNDLYFGVGLTAAPPGWTDERSQSYSAIISFHAWPEREATQGPKIAEKTSNNAFTFPGGYAPKIGKVGGGSNKVYLVEGGRYVEFSTADPDEPVMTNFTMNFARYQIVGGNYMATGPWTKFDNNPFYLRTASAFNMNWVGNKVSKMARTLAWRHNGRMNLAFFDGHVETRPAAETIPARLYLPKGSTITVANLTYDTTDSNNQLID
jgi:prepilin-type processing-associated H-X9-DG protein